MSLKYENSILQMRDYLQPNEQGLNIENHRYLLAVRNMMVDIPANFPQKTKEENKETCICGKDEDMVHINSYKHLNKNEEVNSEEYSTSPNGAGVAEPHLTSPNRAGVAEPPLN